MIKDTLFGASYLAPAFVKRWYQSTMTAKTESTISSSPNERCFQKIPGRKILHNLTHGGDGFAGKPTGGDSPTISESLLGLLPPSSEALLSSPFHAPPTVTPFSIALDTNVTREAEENTTPTRPRQAHIPISNSVTFGSLRQPQLHCIRFPSTERCAVAPRKHAPGRSLPSYDGTRDSRGSRFTESLKPTTVQYIGACVTIKPM
ncbi:hypothetical protein N7532_002164 [Penicillium argentinense]|uniref:Uncharacterized protein n=1 Tax=Penicillium argentinense TaxID=1131581 RepID=A0A9W9KLX3_9EURO|nr:uncharacterized protein N7532_002164 [Penicillium argentinense]KAJ5111629.1 hypothetical protein N7532_002164 [Penicillium argentinense]